MKKFRQTCHKSFFPERSSLRLVAFCPPLIGGEEECNLHTFDCFVRPDMRKKISRWRLKMGRSRLWRRRRRGHTPLQARFVRAHLRACVCSKRRRRKNIQDALASPGGSTNGRWLFVGGGWSHDAAAGKNLVKFPPLREMEKESFQNGSNKKCCGY